MEMEFDVRLYSHDAVYVVEVSIDVAMVASVADVDDVEFEFEVAVYMFLFGFGLDEFVGWAVDKLIQVLEELSGVGCSWVLIIRI